jgi:uncharacterized damage-inducible protein DinB
MSDFGETWRLIRGRFDDAVRGLSHEQLNWRMHPQSLTLGEMALHVAGVEVSFMSQLAGEEPTGDEARLKAAATDGSVNENPFPFAESEITAEKVDWALELARQKVAAMIDDLTPEVRARQVKSALGPVVDGTGAFARIAYHPGYHQGQAYLIKSAPGYPVCKS